MDSPKKILIVDDDEPIRSMYADVFRSEGFAVEEAIDGLNGLEKATSNVPDIIFTGIIMPRMDGYQLKDALSKNVVTANVPVVMSSHMGRKEDETRAREMGVKDFIVQGMVTPREAVERVENILGARVYRIKFNPAELDAARLGEDFHYVDKFICHECQSEMVLELSVGSLSEHEFRAKIICPVCP